MAYGYIPSPLGGRPSSVDIAKASKKDPRDRGLNDAPGEQEVRNARKTPYSRAFNQAEDKSENRAYSESEAEDKQRRVDNYQEHIKDKPSEGHESPGVKVLKNPASRADATGRSDIWGIEREHVGRESLDKSESPTGTVKPALPKSDFDVYNPDSYPEDEFSEQDQRMIDVIARDEPESLEEFKQSIRDQNKKVRDHDYYVMHTPDHPDFADTRKKYEDKYLDYLQRDKTKPFGKAEDEPIDKSEPPTGFEDPSDAMHTPMGRAREDGSNRYPIAPSGPDMVDYEDYEGSSALPVNARKDPSSRAKTQADAKMVAQANADPNMNPDKMAGLRQFQGRDEDSRYSGNKYSVDRIGKSDSEPVEEPESAPVLKSINQMIYDRTYGRTPYSIRK